MKKLKRKLSEIKNRLYCAFSCVFSPDYILVQCKVVDGEKCTKTTFRTGFDEQVEHEMIRSVYQQTNISANYDPLELECEIEAAEQLIKELIISADSGYCENKYMASQTSFCIHYIQRYINFLKVVK